jgi:hypothetical protein
MMIMIYDFLLEQPQSGVGYFYFLGQMTSRNYA